MSSQSFGQAQYRVLPVHNALDTKESLRKSTYSKVRSVLSGTKKLSDVQTKQAFDAYFREYFFPRLSRPQDFGELADSRREFSKLLQMATRAPQVRSYLIQMTYPFMTYLARENFHPATKYTAILMIGDLNSDESLTGSALPTPMPQALQFLLDQYENPQQVDIVRLGTMIGMLRHVTIDRVSGSMAGANRKKIAELMLALVKSKNPPSHRSAAAHVWLQRRAIDILATMGLELPSGDVVPTIEQLVIAPDSPMSLRLTAAESLGKFRYAQNVAKINAVSAAQKLGGLALFACRNEQQRLDAEKLKEELQKKLEAMQQQGGGGEEGGASNMAAMMGAMGGADDGGSGAGSSTLSIEELRKIDLFKIILQSRLYRIQSALGDPTRKTGGLIAAAQGADQAEVVKVATVISDILASVTPEPELKGRAKKDAAKDAKDSDDEDKDLDALLKEVMLKARKLEPLVPVSAQVQIPVAQNKANAAGGEKAGGLNAILGGAPAKKAAAPAPAKPQAKKGAAKKAPTKKKAPVQKAPVQKAPTKKAAAKKIG